MKIGDRGIDGVCFSSMGPRYKQVEDYGPLSQMRSKHLLPSQNPVRHQEEGFGVRAKWRTHETGAILPQHIEGCYAQGVGVNRGAKKCPMVVDHQASMLTIVLKRYKENEMCLQRCLHDPTREESVRELTL